MLPKTILVPIDFSASSDRALDYACELASRCGATVHLLHSIGPALADLPLAEHVAADMMRASADALKALADARASTARISPPFVKIADPRDAILAVARELPADLIVMGTHGRRGVARLMLGSVAEETVRRAPCAVLTLRKGHEEPTP
jgi:nucleotide-binding universal stress UspA family protein